jgi:hypothetical protein
MPLLFPSRTAIDRRVRVSGQGGGGVRWQRTAATRGWQSRIERVSERVGMGGKVGLICCWTRELWRSKCNLLCLPSVSVF